MRASKMPDPPLPAVVGLGYVGLPLAITLASQYPVVAFDIDESRIARLQEGVDTTGEVTPEELDSTATRLRITADPGDLAAANTYVVTVPTPVDSHKQPDLSLVRAAIRTVAEHLDHGDVVIFESTVYPGATEEVCVPVLERISGMRHNRDFFTGYSPERVNPGDPGHRIRDIVKVTAGSTTEAATYVDRFYARVIDAGTHRVSSIAAAEAAKVIENTQRDVNIALINEFAMLFNRLGLDTAEILAAAGTKWNFLRFQPGLVGGHCIGVDPYYLTHRAQAVDHHPELILAGRRINDGMGHYIADRMIKRLLKARLPVVGARILVMGITFKENCPDLRNSRVVDVVRELCEHHAEVDVWDPRADPEQAWAEHGITSFQDTPRPGEYHGIILAVPHREFLELGAGEVRAFGVAGALLFDVKSALPAEDSDLRL